MKFIGQYIQSFIARFRSDVYLEDINTGTIASGSNLGLDSNNKIVKAAETTGDITSVSLISDSGTINGLTGAVNFTVAGGTGISTSATGTTLTVTETSEKKTKSDIDALTGVTENNLGTFTGSTIPDSKNIKEVLQALETKAEVDAAAGTKGVVELATTAESNTGTDTSKAVTPDALNDWTGGSASVTKLGIIGTGEWRGTAIATAYIADDAVTEDKLANTLLAEIDANTAKATNVVTNLDKITHASQLKITSSDGTDVIIAEASGSIAGVMTVAHHDKLDSIENAATADQTKSDIDGLAITTVGTIDTGTWQGTAIASAYLDADTAHLSGTQTFTGAKTFDEDIVGETTVQKWVKNVAYVATQGTTETFIPLVGVSENANEANGSVAMVMPVAGKLLKVHLKTQRDHSGVTTTIKMYNWDADEAHGTSTDTLLGAQSATGPAAAAVGVFDFQSSLDSGTNAFTAGEMLAISITNSSAVSSSCKYFVTLVFELDWASY